MENTDKLPPSYEELDSMLIATRRKGAERKKALRIANKLIQELNLRLANQSWKSKMWESRAIQLGWPKHGQGAIVGKSFRDILWPF